jgi:hypothetical protein
LLGVPTQATASIISASVCLISSLSSGGNDFGKPGGRRGSLLRASLLAWFEFELSPLAHYTTNSDQGIINKFYNSLLLNLSFN